MKCAITTLKQCIRLVLTWREGGILAVAVAVVGAEQRKKE
jgi:hypothetical protein